MNKIYLCYRHLDAHIGRINDHLCKEFGEENIVSDVRKGVNRDNFRAFMKLHIADCQVMLVLIDQNWLAVEPLTGKPYIDNENDIVRQEIARGISQNLHVIPVLLAGASMPDATDLPASLKSIVYLHAAYLRLDPDFQRDTGGLIAAIRDVVPAPKPSPVLSWLWRFVLAGVFILVFCGGVYSFFSLRGLARSLFATPSPTPTSTPTTIPVTATTRPLPTSTPVPLPALINIDGVPHFVVSVSHWVRANGNLPCTGIQTTTLQPASVGKVITPIGVRLRDEPSLQSRQIGGVAHNEVFIALSGPLCSQGHEWWFVNHYGAIGWITGADTEEYWLEPASLQLRESYEWSRNGVYSAFEGGHMFWFEGFRQIFVLFMDNGTWNMYLDEWREGDAEFDSAIVPPQGFYQPTRGFGFIWRNQAEVRSRLNWAIAPETSYSAFISYHFQRDMTNLATYTRLTGYRQLTAPTGVIFTLHDNGEWN